MNFKYLISKLLKKVQIPAVKDSKIDRTAKVCSSSHVVRSKMGRYSYLGNSCTLIFTEVGDFCSIADNCIIGGASHPIDHVSTSPVFHEGKNIMNTNFAHHSFETTKKTIIGNDVWIGNNCLIKSGVQISDGSILGMGSVLTKNIGPYEIWAGNPAKLIRKRFDDDIIEKLLTLKWWELSEKELSKEAHSFHNVVEFLGKGKSR